MEVRLARLTAAVEAQTIDYQGDALRACLLRLRSACIVETDIENLCPGVFEGKRAVGESCDLDSECKDGWCEISNPGGTPCPGTCRAQKSIGTQCLSTSDCSPKGLTGWAECDFSNEQGMCIEKRVGTAATAGMPCGVGDVVANVQTITPCASGLWCSKKNGLGDCRKPIPVGVACASDNDVCEFGSVCLRDVNEQSPRCHKVTVHSQAGAACDDRLVGCNPFSRLECRNDLCTALGDGQVGSPCTREGLAGLVSCNAGRSCDRSSRTCQPNKALNEACSADRECASRFCGGDDKCATLLSCPK